MVPALSEHLRGTADRYSRGTDERSAGTMAGNRDRFVRGQVAWMVGTAVALALVNALTYRLFLVSSLVGFLALVELTSPFDVTPRWRARLKWLVLLALVGFAVAAAWRFVEFLPPGLF